MSKTIARFESGKTYTIQDRAFVQQAHSGAIHVAGTVGENFALASHSNVGNSTVFGGVFVDKKTFNAAIEEMQGAGRHYILDEIIQRNL